MKAAASVDDWLAALSPKHRETANALRALIANAAPDAQEVFSYGIPCFRDSHMLVGVGATTSAVSLHVMSPPLMEKLACELASATAKGATLHFRPGDPLPESLIRTIVAERQRENAARTAARKG